MASKDRSDRVLVRFSTPTTAVLPEKRNKQMFVKTKTIGNLYERLRKELQLPESSPLVCFILHMYSNSNCFFLLLLFNVLHCASKFQVIIISNFAPSPASTLQQLSAVWISLFVASLVTLIWFRSIHVTPASFYLLQFYTPANTPKEKEYFGILDLTYFQENTWGWWILRSYVSFTCGILLPLKKKNMFILNQRTFHRTSFINDPLILSIKVGRDNFVGSSGWNSCTAVNVSSFAILEKKGIKE